MGGRAGILANTGRSTPPFTSSIMVKQTIKMVLFYFADVKR
jgi:hypothetical protein